MQKSNIPDLKKNGVGVPSNSKHLKFDDTHRLSADVSGFERITLRAEPLKDTINLPTAESKNNNKRLILGRRRNSSRSRSSDGTFIRKARGRNDAERPFFDLTVPKNGYAWWYLDGISDDNQKAISIIAFIGSVFSPWYSWYGRKKPHDHCCINVATYGHKGRWTMTERGESTVTQTESLFKIGPSSLKWENNRLLVELNELTTPHLSKLKGRVVIEPHFITNIEVPLMNDGSNIWRPFSPMSKIYVELNL